MTLIKQSRVHQAAADSSRKIPGEEGIWVFVLGDMTVFALFFATFMFSRGKNREIFARDHTQLHVALGTINTVLLLSSSLLVVLAVQRVLAGRRADTWRLFAGALACGAGFVVVKAVEWTRLFAAHKVWAAGILLVLLHVHRYPPVACADRDGDLEPVDRRCPAAGVRR